MRARALQLQLPMAPSVETLALPSPDELERVAKRVPEHVALATRGWLFPEWEEVFWGQHRSLEDLQRDGLTDYASHSLVRAACIPAASEVRSERDLRRIAEQMPHTMPCLFELSPQLTTPRFTHSAVEGAAFDRRRAHANPDFLSAHFFERDVWEPLRRSFDGGRELILNLVFPPLLSRSGIDPEHFVERLEHFWSRVPKEIHFAVEVREPEYLTLGYAHLLAESGMLHVATTWPGMPGLTEQIRLVPSPSLGIVRLAGVLNRDERLRPVKPPYDRLQRRENEPRRELLRCLRAGSDHPWLVVAHNSFEGCAPWSLFEIAQQIAAAS